MHQDCSWHPDWSELSHTCNNWEEIFKRKFLDKKKKKNTKHFSSFLQLFRRKKGKKSEAAGWFQSFHHMMYHKADEAQRSQKGEHQICMTTKWKKRTNSNCTSSSQTLSLIIYISWNLYPLRYHLRRVWKGVEKEVKIYRSYKSLCSAMQKKMYGL